MKILSIETSTDETGVAIVETQKSGQKMRVRVLADVLSSQAHLHSEYGGVYPMLAKREHAKNLGPLLFKALTQAGLTMPIDAPNISKEKMGEIKQILEREPELFVNLATLFSQIKKPAIDVIAITHGPGLEPALWVGVNAAKAISLAWNIPVIPVNHMEGHIIAAIAENSSESEFELVPPVYPALSLLISGGHTELVLSTSPQHYERIGKTRDDAVGEAFDKSARLLGLPYPGGPEISKLAQAAREERLEQPYSLPRPMLNSNDYDFSFSGLKTAVRNLVQAIGKPTDEQKKQIAREVEDAIADVLISKAKAAIEAHAVKTLVVGGGVVANAHIRVQLEKLVGEYEDVRLFLPSQELATDNGRMIAFAAALQTETVQPADLAAHGNLTLDGTKRR